MIQLVYDFVISKIENMKSDNNKYVNRALRTALGVLFTLQLVSTLERQVFDFLGFMWAPIIGNFFQMFIVGLGIVGAFNLSRTLIIVYATWNLLWLGWNIFVICLYLEVGILNRNRERYILTIGSEGKSWWLEHGIGCEVTNTTEVNQQRSSLSDTSVVGCILQYYYVEVIHAAVQCLLSLFGFVASCVCIHFFEEQENSAPDQEKFRFANVKFCTPECVTAYIDDLVQGDVIHDPVTADSRCYCVDKGNELSRLTSVVSRKNSSRRVDCGDTCSDLSLDSREQLCSDTDHLLNRHYP